MRSRFAAFAIRDVEYLWKTLHPDHEDRALPKEVAVHATADFARAMRFMRLTILESRDARVLFFARVFEKGQDRSFFELSHFAYADGAWRYLSGETRTARGNSGELALSTLTPPPALTTFTSIDAWEARERG